MVVTVGSIDSDATHVDIYLTRTLPTVEVEYLASHELKAATPFTITGLDPGATYTVRAKAWSVSDVSAFSDSVTATQPRLFVMGHVSLSAVGETDCDVDIGYQPDAGRLFPSDLIGPSLTNRDFDQGPSTYGGEPKARMVIQLYEMPSPAIHDGDLVCMVIRKELGGGLERWSKIIYDAIVREDAVTYVPPAEEEASAMFENRMFPTKYFHNRFWR